MPNDFSERFRAALASKLPHISDHLRLGDNQSLELRIPSPSGHGDLFVTTVGEEVTVAFGPWHAHFDEWEWWVDETPKGGPFERVLSLLTDLLRDLVVIRIFKKHDKYLMSGPWHSWYDSSISNVNCQDVTVSYISWTGRNDLADVPTDQNELRAWLRRLS